MDKTDEPRNSLSALFQASIRLIRPAAKASAAVHALLWAPIAALATLYFNGIVPSAFSGIATGDDGGIRGLLFSYGATFLAFGSAFILGLLANCASSLIAWSALQGKVLSGKEALAWAFRQRFGAVVLLAVLEMLAYGLLFLLSSVLALLCARILPGTAGIVASGLILGMVILAAAWFNVLLSLSLPALALSGVSAPRAMAASAALIKGSFWKTALASALWYLGIGSLVLSLTMPLSWIAMAPFNAAVADTLAGNPDAAALASALGRAYGSLGLGFGVYLWAAGILAGILRVPFKTLLYASLRARADAPSAATDPSPPPAQD